MIDLYCRMRTSFCVQFFIRIRGKEFSVQHRESIHRTKITVESSDKNSTEFRDLFYENSDRYDWFDDGVLISLNRDIAHDLADASKDLLTITEWLSRRHTAKVFGFILEEALLRSTIIGTK